MRFNISALFILTFVVALQIWMINHAMLLAMIVCGVTAFFLLPIVVVVIIMGMNKYGEDKKQHEKLSNRLLLVYMFVLVNGIVLLICGGARHLIDMINR